MKDIKVVTLVFVLIFVFIGCYSSKKMISDNQGIESEEYLINLDSVPNLTFAQKLEDHDSLVSYIKQISPIIYFNKEVRGIDFVENAKSLRKMITAESSMPQYYNIIQWTINAGQDQHTSLLPTWYIEKLRSDWIPKFGTKIVGYDTTAFRYAQLYDDYYSKAFSTKLNLELVYTDGEYYNLLPFSYKDKKFPQSLKLIACNNKNIHQFVSGMTQLVSSLRWDQNNNRVYYTDFYSSPFIYVQDSLHLKFVDLENKKYTLSIAKQDTVTFLKKKKANFGYNSMDTVITHFFEKQHIFYAKLPQMKMELGDTLSNRLKSIIYDNKVDAIVLDIRGNGGGDDRTYANFLKHLVKDTLQMNVKVGRNYSSLNQTYFDINKDTILNDPTQSFELNGGAALDNPQMYYIQYPKYNFVEPDSIQFPFTGKIYILQDRYIYSSASNLSRLAKESKQLTSIGESTDLLGGLQTVPTTCCLPHSKIFFRVEPQIDFSNTKKKVDIFHNSVEISVKYSIDYLYNWMTTDENVFGKDFIYHKDPMFRRVLELESDKK